MLETSTEALENCKKRIELVANTLQLEGFSRIDAFLNVDSGEVRFYYNSVITFELPKMLGIYSVKISNLARQ